MIHTAISASQMAPEDAGRMGSEEGAASPMRGSVASGYPLTLMRYETVIGIECHVELSTQTKMFCGCRNSFGADPNTNVCPVCLGHPGSLPVPNAAAIASIVKIGLALDCSIAPRAEFSRKNYFYPDMPKNFQISQYDLPTCLAGHLDIDVQGEEKRIGITRVHMEEDTGKTTHQGATGRIHDAEYALVDFNRAGVPLVEIVSEPDIRSPEEAGAYLRALRSTLESLDVSDVRMEEGSLRCDANVSIRPEGTEAFGTRVEIKNMNSIRSLERAIRYEVERQTEAIEAGENVAQETRHWSENDGKTISMRSKEEAFDYRYFPEPDIPPLEPADDWIEGIRATLPELPADRKERYASALGLKPAQASILSLDRGLATFFESVLAIDGTDAVAAANWLTQDVSGMLNEHSLGITDAPVTPQHVADLVRLTTDDSVSGQGAKAVLADLFDNPDLARTIEQILDAKGLRQVSDTGELGAICDAVIEGNPDQVAQFRSGKEAIIGFLVGQVMKQSGGSANPKLARELLRERL